MSRSSLPQRLRSRALREPSSPGCVAAETGLQTKDVLASLGNRPARKASPPWGSAFPHFRDGFPLLLPKSARVRVRANAASSKRGTFCNKRCWTAVLREPLGGNCPAPPNIAARGHALAPFLAANTAQPPMIRPATSPKMRRLTRPLHAAAASKRRARHRCARSNPVARSKSRYVCVLTSHRH